MSWTGAFAIGLALAFGASAQAADEPAPKRPHIVFVLADDLGWGDVGFHDSDLATPHLDALAASGARLANHYAQPVCTASRAALLTGRYPFRYGLQSGAIKPWSRFGLPLSERTLATSLSEAGYETVLVGKWHLGHHAPEMLPTARGFDHHYGFYNDAIDYFEHTSLGGLDWHRDGEPLREEGYATQLLGREARRVIAAHDPDTPLFLLVAFNAPHIPLQVPKEALARVPESITGKRRTFAAMVALLDDEVGGILQALDEKGMADDTIVVFTSDNGANPLHGGSNAPLRGGKTSLYEGGVRVPAVVRWPGRIEPGSEVSEVLHLIDWAPTFVSLGGAERDVLALPGQAARFDGLDLGPLLLGQIPALPPRDVVLNVGYRASALRSGRFKIVRTAAPPVSETPFTTEVFELRTDPLEEHDVKDANPQITGVLERRLARWGRQAVPAATQSAEARARPPGWKPPAVYGVFPDDDANGASEAGAANEGASPTP